MEQMMDHFGQVMEVEEDHKALVKIRRNDACSKCGKCGGFIGDMNSRGEMMVEAVNPINAKAGQFVRLETKSGNVLLAAVLLYFVPLVGLLAGLFIGRYWAINAMPSLNADLVGLALGLIIMILVFYFLRLSETRLARTKRFDAVIAAVVTEEAADL